jgi:hypothetical protein
MQSNVKQIPNRTQFKHVLFGPQVWSNGQACFPYVVDAVAAGDWTLAKTQVEKTAAILKRASKKMVGNL